MELVGLALAFLVFWSLVAIGVFMTVHYGRRLLQRPHRPLWMIADGAMTFLGILMVCGGGYATYVLLYGR